MHSTQVEDIFQWSVLTLDIVIEQAGKGDPLDAPAIMIH